MVEQGRKFEVKFAEKKKKEGFLMALIEKAPNKVKSESDAKSVLPE